MNKKLKYVIIIALCIAIVSGTYVIGFSSKSEKGSVETQNLLSAQVFKGDIKVTASGSSNVEPSIKKEIKSPDNSGIVESIFVEEGDFVQEGDLVLTFENSDTSTDIENLKLDLAQEEIKLEELESSIEDLKIYAGQSGYIGEINAEVGDELSNGYTLTTISDKSKVEISGYFHEKTLEYISVGDKGTIILPDYLTEINGVVTKVNKTPIPKDTGAILYEVVMEAEKQGGFTDEVKGTVVVNNSHGTFTSVEESYFESPTPEEVKVKVSGELSKLYVSSGEYVEKGTLLAEIESSSIQNDIENQNLALEKKKNELAEKIKDLDDTAVYAPISGFVTQIDVTEGERVSSNTVLMTISDLNNLEVVIPVDELDINNIELGQEAIVTAEAIPDVSFNADVSKIALEGDINNGVATFDVTLSLKEVNGLKPGMSVNAEIIIDSKEDTLLVPIEAIQSRQGKKFVLVKENEDSSEAEAVEVEIGLVSEDYVEIVEGLNEGDIVIYQSTANNEESQQRQGMGMMNIGMPPSDGGNRQPRSSGGGR